MRLLIPDTNQSPREGTNKESPGWHKMLGNAPTRKAIIDMFNMIEEDRANTIEGNIQYYMRRGNKAYFLFNGRKITAEGEGIADQFKGMKYGTYPARFTLQ